MPSNKTRDTNQSSGVRDSGIISERKEDLSSITFHLTIFSILFSLTFAYFVYFSHQITSTQTEMISKVYEINSINVPHPWSFLTISGHKEYYYIKRRDALRLEFLILKNRIDNPNLTEEELSASGKEIQKVITQVAYFFPYKKILDFKKDGSVVFNPRSQNAIDVTVPINIEFLKTQVDEICNWNSALTLELKDGKDRIARAMILAAGIKNDNDKLRVGKYLDGLIEYLDKHYQLAVPLGLIIKQYEFLLNKNDKSKIIGFAILIAFNFLFGVLLPLFIKRLRYNRYLEICTQLSFIVGIIFLFKEALFSFPL